MGDEWQWDAGDENSREEEEMGGGRIEGIKRELSQIESVCLGWYESPWIRNGHTFQAKTHNHNVISRVHFHWQASLQPLMG